MQSLFSLSQYHYYEGSDMTPMKEIELYKNKEIDQMAQRVIHLIGKGLP